MTYRNFQDLGLEDPYITDGSDLARYLAIANSVAKITTTRRRTVPKYKSGSIFSQLPDRRGISQRIRELHQDFTGTNDANWYELKTKLRSTYKHRQIDIHELGEDFQFFFPKSIVVSAHDDWYHWLCAIELALRNALMQGSQRPFTSKFKNWFVGDAYVRALRVGEPLQGWHLCLASVEIRQNYTGQGLSQFLFGSLQEVAMRVGVPFEIENAQPRLSAHLHRLGWLRKYNRPECRTWIDPATVPTDSWTAKHLIENWATTSK